MPEDGTVKSSDIPQRLKIRVSSTNAIELEAYDRLTAKVHLSKPTGSDEGLNTRNYYAAKKMCIRDSPGPVGKAYGAGQKRFAACKVKDPPAVPVFALLISEFCFH